MDEMCTYRQKTSCYGQKKSFIDEKRHFIDQKHCSWIKSALMDEKCCFMDKTAELMERDKFQPILLLFDLIQLKLVVI